MTSDKRRAAGRRRAWGRGPIILRFEPLEERQLLATAALPDLVSVAFDTVHNLDWGQSVHAKGIIANQGNAAVTVPFHVDIYASPTPGIGTTSVRIGEVTIPAALQAGQQYPYDQVVSLPPSPLTGMDSTGSIYLDTVIDPEAENAFRSGSIPRRWCIPAP